MKPSKSETDLACLFFVRPYGIAQCQACYHSDENVIQSTDDWRGVWNDVKREEYPDQGHDEHHGDFREESQFRKQSAGAIEALCGDDVWAVGVVSEAHKVVLIHHHLSQFGGDEPMVCLAEIAHLLILSSNKVNEIDVGEASALMKLRHYLHDGAQHCHIAASPKFGGDIFKVDDAVISAELA